MRGFRVPGVLAAFAIGLASSCEGAERRHSVSGENECYELHAGDYLPLHGGLHTAPELVPQLGYRGRPPHLAESTG